MEKIMYWDLEICRKKLENFFLSLQLRLLTNLELIHLPRSTLSVTIPWWSSKAPYVLVKNPFAIDVPNVECQLKNTGNILSDHVFLCQLNQSQNTPKFWNLNFQTSKLLFRPELFKKSTAIGFCRQKEFILLIWIPKLGYNLALTGRRQYR